MNPVADLDVEELMTDRLWAGDWSDAPDTVPDAPIPVVFAQETHRTAEMPAVDLEALLARTVMCSCCDGCDVCQRLVFVDKL